jgi:hypothetical protein
MGMMRGLLLLFLAGCSGFDANLNVDFAGTMNGTLKSKVVNGAVNATVDETGIDGDLSVAPPPKEEKP